MKKIFMLFILSLILLPFVSALTSGEGAILFGSIFSLTIVVIFFLVLSIMTNNPPMKMFFLGLSLLTLLASVGMGVSIMQEFFTDIDSITETYGQFYILLVSLTGAGVIALIVWLVVVAFRSFYSYRGLSKDSDEFD